MPNFKTKVINSNSGRKFINSSEDSGTNLPRFLHQNIWHRWYRFDRSQPRQNDHTVMSHHPFCPIILFENGRFEIQNFLEILLSQIVSRKLNFVREFDIAIQTSIIVYLVPQNFSWFKCCQLYLFSDFFCLFSN